MPKDYRELNPPEDIESECAYCGAPCETSYCNNACKWAYLD